MTTDSDSEDVIKEKNRIYRLNYNKQPHIVHKNRMLYDMYNEQYNIKTEMLKQLSPEQLILHITENEDDIMLKSKDKIKSIQLKKNLCRRCLHRLQFKCKGVAKNSVYLYCTKGQFDVTRFGAVMECSQFKAQIIRDDDD